MADRIAAASSTLKAARKCTMPVSENPSRSNTVSVCVFLPRSATGFPDAGREHGSERSAVPNARPVIRVLAGVRQRHLPPAGEGDRGPSGCGTLVIDANLRVTREAGVERGRVDAPEGARG